MGLRLLSRPEDIEVALFEGLMFELGVSVTEVVEGVQ